MTQPYIADFDLERLALGELADEEASALQAALQRDAEALARFNNIAASNDDILKMHPVDDVKREVESRLRQVKGSEALAAKTSFTQRLMRWSVVAACAVLAVVMVLPEVEEESGYRMKGMASYLVAHKVSSGGLERLDADGLVQAGDRLQLSVVGAAEQYAVVCSLDGNGEVTLHFPMDGESTKLTESPSNLPNSYELDDAPGFERFVLITSSKPLQVEDILGKIRTMGAVPDARVGGLPEGVHQSSLVVKKP
jgi:anti-sigma factor RsiW